MSGWGWVALISGLALIIGGGTVLVFAGAKLLDERPEDRDRWV